MYRRNHTKKTKQIVIELLKQNLSAKSPKVSRTN